MTAERTVTQATDEGVAGGRGAGIAGLAFVVLYVAGVFTSGGTPENDASDQEWFDWFADSGNRWTEVIGMVLLAASGIAFLFFLSGLVRRIRATGRPAGEPVTIGWAAGLVFVAMVMIGGVAINQAAVGIEIGEMNVPTDADVLRMAEQAGFGILLLCGGWSAALAIGALSLAARRTGALPTWLTTAGFVAGALLVLSVLWFPMVALPLWVLAAGVVLLRSGAPQTVDLRSGG